MTSDMLAQEVHEALAERHQRTEDLREKLVDFEAEGEILGGKVEEARIRAKLHGGEHQVAFDELVGQIRGNDVAQEEMRRKIDYNHKKERELEEASRRRLAEAAQVEAESGLAEARARKQEVAEGIDQTLTTLSQQLDRYIEASQDVLEATSRANKSVGQRRLDPVSIVRLAIRTRLARSGKEMPLKHERIERLVDLDPAD